MRRFALAIRRESVAGSRWFITLNSVNPPWNSAPVLVASTWIERWVGVRGMHHRVLLPTGAVHGRGVASPIRVVGIDLNGTVVAVQVLDPGRFLWMAGAAWVLEMPTDDDPPAVDMVLSIYPR